MEILVVGIDLETKDEVAVHMHEKSEDVYECFISIVRRESPFKCMALPDIEDFYTVTSSAHIFLVAESCCTLIPHRKHASSNFGYMCITWLLTPREAF